MRFSYGGQLPTSFHFTWSLVNKTEKSDLFTLLLSQKDFETRNAGVIF